MRSISGMEIQPTTGGKQNSPRYGNRHTHTRNLKTILYSGSVRFEGLAVRGTTSSSVRFGTRLDNMSCPVRYEFDCVELSTVENAVICCFLLASS